MKKFSKYIGILILSILLTLVTQIGGVILLICIPIFNYINRFNEKKWLRNLLKTSVFCIFYLLSTFFIVPTMAEWNGRTPMPFNNDHPNLKQHTLLTVILNRHYVTPQLKTVTEGVASKMAKKYGDTCVITYLECNFPFFDGFRLYPHLSHNDGQKIDLSFQYLDKTTKESTSNRPSWLGYGVCEEPKAGEENQAEMCEEKGEWQYSIMKKYLIYQGNKEDYLFDSRGTQDMVRFFLNDNHVSFVMIEPHLKKRLGFEQVIKVRRPPCSAVRHDDHIHVAIY
jgi:hypothetical protein